jgi:hypothetical protein
MLLLKLMSVVPECEDEIMKTLEVIRAVASHKKATSPKDRAFHRWCVEVNVDWLGDGVCDPRDGGPDLQTQRDIALLRPRRLLPWNHRRDRLADQREDQ